MKSILYIGIVAFVLATTGCMNNPPKNVSDPTNGQGGFIDADGGSDGNSGGTE
jgi:hypothetical protein